MSEWISVGDGLPKPRSLSDVWYVDKWRLQQDDKYHGERLLNMTHTKKHGFNWTEASRYPQTIPFDSPGVTHWTPENKPPNA